MEISYQLTSTRTQTKSLKVIEILYAIKIDTTKFMHKFLIRS